MFYESSPYRKENTLHHYKDQLVNAVKEIIAENSENHTKPVNTLCGQNAELLIVK
jgi:hypothetical protein